MTLRSGFILLLIGGSLAACSSAKPELGSIGSLDGISLDSTQKSMSANNWLVPFSGKCKSIFSDVEWSDNGGTTWTSIKISDPSATVDCGGTGTFKGTLDLSTSTSVSPKITAKLSTSILFRGVSDLGNSDSLAFLLIPPPGTTTPEILVGSHSTSSGGYVFKGQVGGNFAKSITSGYVLQGQVHYK